MISIFILLIEIIAAIIFICILLWLSFKTYLLYQSNFIRSKIVDQSFVNKATINEYRKSTYPSYPRGWYPLCWSNELKKGEIIQKNALGKSFAIYRGTISGEIAVLDAYCPHMGANLTVGGKVCGDDIQCPFHSWKFNKNGNCTDIPYLKSKNNKIPKNAKTNAYPSCEYHGMVCVYYHESMNNVDFDGNIIPSYNLPIQKELLTEEYEYNGCLDYGIINMHIQEFAENAADWMHFGPVHGKMMFPFTQTEIPLISRWLTINHIPETYIGGGSGHDSEIINKRKYGPDNKNFLYFINKSNLKWNGKPIPKTSGNANITFCGPAGVCIFRMNLPSYDKDAEILLFHTHLPENEMNLRVKFHWYSSKKLPNILVWYVVGNWISQWTNDISIWENKILLKKPCLVRGDGPVLKVRRWWKTFYPQQNKQENNKKIAIDSNHDDKEKEQEKEIQIQDKTMKW